MTDQGTLEFKGIVSLENNGGFASIRSGTANYDLSDFEGLLIRVRGDGHRYAFNLRTDFEITAGSYSSGLKRRRTSGRRSPCRSRASSPHRSGRSCATLRSSILRRFAHWVSRSRTSRPVRSS